MDCAGRNALVAVPGSGDIRGTIIPPCGRPPNKKHGRQKPGAEPMTDAPATDSAEYVPPKVWTWNKASGGRFASINRPIAGATHEAELPVGKHPFQLYSLATPNGVKVTVMFEELL